MKHFDVALSRNLRFSRCRFPLFSRLDCQPIDAVPLVDLALLGLLFMVLTSAVVRRPGLLLELPRLGGPVASVPYHRAVLSLVSHDRIYLDELRILPEDLADGLRRLQRAFPGEALVIEVSRDTPFQLYADAVHAAREAGFEQVLFAGEAAAPRLQELPTP